MRPRKRFGQHWLKSDKVLNQIIEAATLEKSDRILEIGPGTGMLTRRLFPEVNSVVAVEIDRDLIKTLVRQWGKIDNFLLLEGDFLKLDVDTFLTDFPNFQNPNKVVANIPYNITSPILEKLLGTISHPHPKQYDSIVLLVQKEIGERLIAQPKTKAYGAFSVRMQYLATCEWICDVPRKAFSPPPKVESVVIRLCPQTINYPVNNPKQLDIIIKLGFANRRKMLRNNLKSLIPVEILEEHLITLQINPQVRAEELSLIQWIDLSNKINR
ncbi:MAG: 16S rRNA (adenine(1518)-N(6)/adenine(1519)-N(6))-dimethyltransferase RsmA [Microcystaceae cyanobacterium]